MEAIVIHILNTKSDLYPQVWALREAILRQPLGLSLKNEDLSGDDSDVIVAAAVDDKITGCLMLKHISPDTVKLRAMAVYTEWQGKDVGRTLVNAAEQYAAEHGYKKVELHARKVALGFYEKLGYSITGGEFKEVGIPHYKMWKMIGK